MTRPVAPALIASEQALALPPPGGPAIIGVIERRRSNGVEQTISLATASGVPGQNYLRIQFFGAEAGRGPASTFRTISEREMAREAAAAIPGIRLSRRTTFLQNSYGPFAYAAGRSAAGDTCLYAWQQIRAGSTSGGIGRNFGMIQARWRLCNRHATEEQLLSAVYGYTIVGTFEGEAWNPFGEPASPDPRLGKTGHPIYPRSISLANGMPIGYAGGVDRTRTSSVVVRPASRPAQRPRAEPDPEKAAAPQVPLPEGTSAPVSAGTASSTPGQAGRMTGVTVPPPENFLSPQP